MMGRKKDSNVSAGQKLLKMYHILLSDNKPHYQSDLAEILNCSAKTVTEKIVNRSRKKIIRKVRK
ncbi:hypothetical protein A9G22_10815 [Gilliamella sp. App2-1]|nr:hypothetical protein A9G23_09580 [Gilliamella apicola]OCG20228.1 hypothetical protein A9G22_10815 [Gilliamella apicola]